MSTQSNSMPESFDSQKIAPAAMSATRPLYWSIRRELWENRSIYIAPLAVAVVVLFAFSTSAILGIWESVLRLGSGHGGELGSGAHDARARPHFAQHPHVAVEVAEEQFRVDLDRAADVAPQPSAGLQGDLHQGGGRHGALGVVGEVPGLVGHVVLCGNRAADRHPLVRAFDRDDPAHEVVRRPGQAW